MLYDTSIELEKRNFLARATMLADRGEVVELTGKRVRTLPQNKYLHVILGYFAALYGESPEYVKEEYFKRLVNHQYFVVSTHVDKYTGKTRQVCRSSAELSREEMSVCIDRFRSWASKEAGIYIPTAEEGEAIRQCEVEASKTQRHY